MAKSPKRAAALRAQPGYITLRRLSFTHMFSEPVASRPWSMPSTAQWRLAMDRAGQILQAISEEMQTYSDGRVEDWHGTPGAQRFHETLAEVYELQARIDDLRSNY